MAVQVVNQNNRRPSSHKDEGPDWLSHAQVRGAGAAPHEKSASGFPLVQQRQAGPTAAASTRIAGARWTGDEQVMASGRGHLHRPAARDPRVVGVTLVRPRRGCSVPGDPAEHVLPAVTFTPFHPEVGPALELALTPRKVAGQLASDGTGVRITSRVEDLHDRREAGE